MLTAGDLRVFAQQAHDQRGKLPGDVGVALRHVHRVVVEDVGEGGHQVGILEGRNAGRILIQDGAKGVKVATQVDLPPARLFGDM